MTFKLSHLSQPIETDEGLQAAILQSLLNHERAALNDPIEKAESKRGWWARQYLPAVGCRDWTLKREKLNNDTLNRAIRHTKKALDWLTEQGHVLKIEVIGEYKNDRLNRLITITKKDNSKMDFEL